MPERPATNVTVLLDRIREGDDDAAGDLLGLVYEELRQIAAAIHRSGRKGHTLQPTALVHEAWMKLDGRLGAFEGRSHFFAVAAKAMRHVLADHAKALRREKRGGSGHRMTLVDDQVESPIAEVDPVDLDDCLDRLAALHERQAQVVEYRLFGGLTIGEIADLLDVSRRTIDTDWNMARAWLTRELLGAERMDADRYARIREVFEGARRIEPGLRAAFLDNECDGDAGLRAEVEALLEASDAARESDNDFADTRIGRQREALERLRPQRPAGIPERIDRYRITRHIATGGMGAVYEAAQDHPSRTVAIKMIDPRRSSPALVSRFRREAEILGRLKHPGIAQIFDASSIDIGEGAQPYLVMEYVEGDPLTKHADDAKLDTRGRLELLARVCDAVDYAHRQGVIHRDLKPDNVLVDTEGRAKVLDFGIARATDDSTMVATQVTQDGQLLGTLAYMAPEQLGGKNDEVTPAADVYALGVIAYELLASRLPHDVAGLSLGHAVRLLTDEDAARLSAHDTRLRGDVETIVGTALEKDIARRYPSAAALATDIRRHLADEPILARPASRIYRVRKFTRRNRALVGGACATLVTLVTGLVIAVVLGAREREQRLASERMTYRTSVIAATRALAERQPSAAAAHLAEAPEYLRGWEWREVHARLDVSVRTIDAGHEIRTCRMAPDGSWYVTRDNEGMIRTWDAAWQPRLTIDAERVGGPTVFLRDGGREIVAVSMNDETETWIGVWNSQDGALISRHAVESVKLAGGTVTPDGQIIVVVDADRIATIEIASGRVLGRSARYSMGTAGALSVRAICPDGKMVVVGRPKFGDRALLELPGLEPIAEMETISGRLGEMAFSPDGTRLAIGYYDGAVQLWDMTTGIPRELVVMNDHERPVNCVTFSPDGSLLATSSYPTARLWDGRTGAPRAVFAGGTMIEALLFSPDGTRLVCPQRNGVVRIWDTTPEARGTLTGHRSYVYDLALTPAAKTLLTVGWDGHPPASRPGCVRWWDAASGQPFAAWGDARTHAVAAAMAPDGSVGAVLVRTAKDNGDAGYDGRLVLFDMATGATVGSVSLPIGKTGDVGFEPRGGTLRVDAGTGRVLFLDPSTLDTVFELAAVHAVWSPDGRWIAVGTASGSIELRDGTDFTVVRSWSASSGAIQTMTFDAEGRLLLTTASQDDSIGVWDVATGARMASLLGHGRPNAPAFSPDGERLASPGNDELVRIWRTDTWAQVGELHGHEGYVYRVLWTPDGERLFSCGQDGDVRVWDARPPDVRRAAIAERTALVEELAPRVEALFAELDDAAAVVARLEADATLAPRAREVALQLAFGEAMARRPEGVRIETPAATGPQASK